MIRSSHPEMRDDLAVSFKDVLLVGGLIGASVMQHEGYTAPVAVVGDESYVSVPDNDIPRLPFGYF